MARMQMEPREEPQEEERVRMRPMRAETPYHDLEALLACAQNLLGCGNFHDDVQTAQQRLAIKGNIERCHLDPSLLPEIFGRLLNTLKV